MSQLESLWASIDEEMRAKNAITDKMLKIQQEMEICSSLLGRESQAHIMTRENLNAAKSKLEVKIKTNYLELSYLGE